VRRRRSGARCWLDQELVRLIGVTHYRPAAAVSLLQTRSGDDGAGRRRHDRHDVLVAVGIDAQHRREDQSEGEASSVELTGLVREHLDGALMLFAVERSPTYTADPERMYRALTAPGATCDQDEPTRAARLSVTPH
jgi:hypothetical protein